MTQPFVAAICLTRDRPEMLKRAVRSFHAQTYPDKSLLIWNNGALGIRCLEGVFDSRIMIVNDEHANTGELRNRANNFAGGDIFVHWDDDDWSHPDRITEQVALLQASGRDCVGYRDMLFWRHPLLHTVTGDSCPTCRADSWSESDDEAYCDCGEAWLYTNADTRYALGTSLCYWRKTWERNKFKHVSSKEDSYFVRSCDTLGVSVLEAGNGQPRMIASIHGGNTGGGYTPFPPDPMRWKRVPEWDNLCREIMESK